MHSHGLSQGGATRALSVRCSFDNCSLLTESRILQGNGAEDVNGPGDDQAHIFCSFLQDHRGL